MRVRNLCKRFGERRVLRDVSFTAERGVTVLWAPSGAGKTTLLRILLGLETADSGEIQGNAARWSAVFQEDRLLEGMSAAGNLRFALGAAYSPDAAAPLLAELGLDLEDPRPVRLYSGGMKRRLALARALLAPADALALDEPFTGMDEENHQRAAACIRRAAEKMPVLLVTHRREDVALLGAACIEL